MGKNNKKSGQNKYKGSQPKRKPYAMGKKQKQNIKIVKAPQAPKFHGVTVSGGDTTSMHSAELKVERFFNVNHRQGGDGPPKFAARNLFVLAFETAARYMFPEPSTPPASIAGQSNTRNRIGRVIVEMLQKPQTDTSDAFEDTMLTVIAQVPTAAPDGDSKPQYIATRSTRVQPSVNEKWVEVLNYDAENIFRQGQLLPYLTSDTCQAIAALAVHNPNTGLPVNGKNFNFRATIYFGQPIPVAGIIRTSEYYHPSWESALNADQQFDGSSGDPVDLPVLVSNVNGYVAIAGMKRTNT
jgi:hypothetical protein